MLCWSEVTGQVTTYRGPAGNSNGNTRDREGRLVTCEHLARRVTRTEHDGRITVLMDRYDGQPLNAPNDVVVHSDGSVWFTDPGYGILGNYEGDRAEAQLPRHVYRLDPSTGEGIAVVSGMDRPNGLCFSPDESRLYVVDVDHIRVFDLDGTRPVGGRVFVDTAPGFADGVRCDRDGNVWASAAGGGPGYDGVHCYSPQGALLGQIHLPEMCANLCFGGSRRTGCSWRRAGRCTASTSRRSATSGPDVRRLTTRGPAGFRGWSRPSATRSSRRRG
jgi:gluconolactonase